MIATRSFFNVPTSSHDKLLPQVPFLSSICSVQAVSFSAMHSSIRNQVSPSPSRSGMWTREEHKLYLQALRQLKGQPWRVMAAFIGTRTERQLISHHQKYMKKLSRRAQNPGEEARTREEHEVDMEVLDHWKPRGHRLAVASADLMLTEDVIDELFALFDVKRDDNADSNLLPGDVSMYPF